MFQSSKERISAEDMPICVKCLNDTKCKFKPERTEWRFVLNYYQRFKEE